MVAVAALCHQRSAGARPQKKPPVGQERRCPLEMALVDERFCIDRWEVSMVDHESGKPLSPYYPPHPRLLTKVRKVWLMEQPRTGNALARRFPLPQLPSWQHNQSFEARAVSKPGAVPQGYLTYYLAKKACKNAGKRLCTEDEWVQACQGRQQRKFPYGSKFKLRSCNVYRYFHPARVLHGDASSGHRDPRLNLLFERGKDPGLRLTGATASCVSHWDEGDIYDMVGNLDEWVADPKGRFLGGFYARSTKEGCEASVSTHSAAYFDYSLGTRCCTTL